MVKVVFKIVESADSSFSLNPSSGLLANFLRENLTSLSSHPASFIFSMIHFWLLPSFALSICSDNVSAIFSAILLNFYNNTQKN